jgi:hypothetical protein
MRGVLVASVSRRGIASQIDLHIPSSAQAAACPEATTSQARIATVVFELSTKGCAIRSGRVSSGDVFPKRSSSATAASTLCASLLPIRFTLKGIVPRRFLLFPVHRQSSGHVQTPLPVKARTAQIGSGRQARARLNDARVRIQNALS